MKNEGEWVLREIEKHLPFYSRTCDCSADLVYYIDLIRKKLKQIKRKK